MNRAQMLYATDSIIDLVKTIKEDKEPVVFIPLKPDLLDEEKIEDEYESLGYFISKNPLDDHKARFSQLNTVEDMTSEKDGEGIHVAGLITDLKFITTKKGREMACFVLEDLTGRIEVIIFPHVFIKNKELLKKNSIVEIIGSLEIQKREINGEEKIIPKIKATKITPIKKGKIIDKVILYPSDKDDFEKICDIIKSYPGNTRVEIDYHNITLKSKYKFFYDNTILQKLEFNCRMQKIYQE